MIRLFCGWDEREAAGLSVFVNSVISRASMPVAVIPLHGRQKDGTNAFTYARFDVLRACDYEGWAIFADGSDMVCVEDIAELWKLRDERYAVQVVKHDYKSKAKIKYIGTDMECPNQNYERKNWSSLVLWNCQHPSNEQFDSTVGTGKYLHRFAWLKDEEIGALPADWNWLADEQGASTTAKIIHWTQGIPAFAHYRNAPMAAIWHREYEKSQRGNQLLGETAHV